MLTRLYLNLSQDDDRIKDAMEFMTREHARYAQVGYIQFTYDPEGFGCCISRYLCEIPEPRVGLEITKVIIEASFAGSVTPGLYQRRTVRAQADS